MHAIAPPAAVLLVGMLSHAVLADDKHYFPRVSGPPAGTVRGTLINYGVGMGSGDVTIRRSDGTDVSFYIAGTPFLIDGKRIRCPLPPAPPHYEKPSADLCTSWPASVRIGTTRVSVPYWTGRRYGKPTLVTRGFTVLRT
jgi:hypothetical protein